MYLQGYASRGRNKPADTHFRYRFLFFLFLFTLAFAHFTFLLSFQLGLFLCYTLLCPIVSLVTFDLLLLLVVILAPHRRRGRRMLVGHTVRLSKRILRSGHRAAGVEHGPIFGRDGRSTPAVEQSGHGSGHRGGEAGIRLGHRQKTAHCSRPGRHPVGHLCALPDRRTYRNGFLLHISPVSSRLQCPIRDAVTGKEFVQRSLGWMYSWASASFVVCLSVRLGFVIGGVLRHLTTAKERQRWPLIRLAFSRVLYLWLYWYLRSQISAG